MTPPQDVPAQRIARLREALEAGTPGPWITRITEDGHDPRVYVTRPNVAEGGPMGGRYYVAFLPPDGLAATNPDADAALIVAAVNALPALLAIAEAAAAHVTAEDDRHGTDARDNNTRAALRAALARL